MSSEPARSIDRGDANPHDDISKFKHSLYIDQLTLEFWVNRKLDPAKLSSDSEDSQDQNRYLNHTIDAVDAFLISLIADLNPQNEAVRKLMYRGHFLVTLEYAKERLPLLGMEERGISRRLRWLVMMGILERTYRTVTGNKRLAYYRCSGLFWRIQEKRHAVAGKAARTVKEDSEDQKQKAMAPVVHGSDNGIEKAMAPVDMSHGPSGTCSLSNIGNINLPAAATAGLPDGPPAAAGATEGENPEAGDGVKVDSLGVVVTHVQLQAPLPGERDPKLQKDLATWAVKLFGPAAVPEIVKANPELTPAAYGQGGEEKSA